jgi:uncharacterized membrane protein
MRPALPALGRCLGILVLTAAATTLYALDVESPVRTAVTLVFVFFGPGLVLTELVDIHDTTMRLAVAPAASLAVATLVAVLLIYTSGFTADGAVIGLAGVTCAGIALVVLRETWRHLAPSDAPAAS